MSDLNDLIPPPEWRLVKALPEWRLVKAPPPSKWSWSFGPSYSIRWTPALGDEPNWFHRWTQRLVLGIYWRRDP